MIFNSKYKKAGSDLYEAVGEIYNFISNEINKIEDLKDVTESDELFPNELLFILLFFTTVKVQEYFDDKTVSNKILNEFHNTYYSVLENDLNLSKEEVKNINIVLNKRYSSYNKMYDGSDKIVMNITNEFLKNIKVDHKNNLKVMLSLSFWLVKANELLNELMKKLENNYKI